MWAIERVGADLNADGDVSDVGYFFARGDGPFVFLHSGRPFGLNQGARARTRSGSALMVVEYETDRGVDLNGDGAVTDRTADVLVSTPNAVVQVIHRTNVMFTPTIFLGNGALGGVVLIRPDGTVIVPPNERVVLGYSGAGLLLGVGGPTGMITGQVFLPQGGAEIPVSVSSPIQLDDSVWAPDPLCRFAPDGSSVCIPVGVMDSALFDGGAGSAVAWGVDRSIVGDPTRYTFVVARTGVATKLGEGLKPVDLRGESVYVPLRANGSIDIHVRTFRDGSLGPILFANKTDIDPKVFRLGDGRAFIDLYEGNSADQAAGVGADPDAVDLNGNGRVGDTVTHLFDGASLTNLNVTGRFGYSYAGFTWGELSIGGPAFLATGEASSGVDLNGDTDQTDIGAVIVTLSGRLSSLGLSIAGDSGDGASDAVALVNYGNGEAVVKVREKPQNVDLDGDGVIEPGQIGRWFLIEPDLNIAVSSGFRTPARLLDTRLTGPQVGYVGAKPSAGQIVEVQVAGRGGVPASGVTAVALNVTATDATAPGFVTVWGAGPQPATSNLNVESAGQTVPNLVVASVGADGKVRIFTQSGSPLGRCCRVVGNRLKRSSACAYTTSGHRADGPQVGFAGAKPVAGQMVELQVAGRAGVPASRNVVVMNVTMTQVSAPEFVTVWGDGPRPGTSNLNAERAGQTVPNLVIVRTAKAGVGDASDWSSC